MPCTITYKGKNYSEEEFKNYVQTNIEEFEHLIPKDVADVVNYSGLNKPGDSLIGRLADIPLSTEENSRIAKKYFVQENTPEHKSAIKAEIVKGLSRKSNNEVTLSALDELTKSFATMTASEIQNLNGFERDLYNIATEQKTKFLYYPNVKSSEIAFPNEDGSWNIIDREKFINDAEQGKLDIESELVLNRLVSQVIEESYKEGQDYSNEVDYSKILNDSQKNKLKDRLFNTLEKLGFSVIKLEEYKSSYKLKYGVDPSVNAVADIARRLIAITEGNITDDILSEEVAHILTETYNNQDEIRNILPEVENTPEWAEFSDIYFKLYEGKGLSGEMLTEKVRREILGKIISTKILETATPETLLGRIQQIVNNFFSSIKRMLLPSVKSRLNNLVDIIAEAAVEEGKLKTLFSEDNLLTNPFSDFYNATPSLLTSKIEAMIKNSRKLLSKNRGGVSVSKIDAMAEHLAKMSDASLSEEIKSQETLKAISNYIDITNNIKRDVFAKINQFDNKVKAGETPKVFLGGVEAASANILLTESLPHLQTLLGSIDNIPVTPETAKLKATLETQLKGLVTDINKMKGEIELRNATAVDNLIEYFIPKFGLTENAANTIRNYLKGQQKDISMLQMFFGNLQNSNNIVLGLMSRVISDLTHKTDSATHKFRLQFMDTMKKLGIRQEDLDGMYKKVIQKDADGKITGYLNSVIDWSKFENEMNLNKLEAYNKALEIFIKEHNSNPSNQTLVYEPITNLKEIGTKPNTPLTTSFVGDAKRLYNSIIDTWREDNLEYPHTESFRAQRDKMISEIRTNGITLQDGTVVKEIPDVVLEMMKGWSLERRRIKTPYTKDGIVDYSQMSEYEKSELEALKKDRLEAKSEVDITTGEVKTGRELEIARALQAIEQYYIQSNISKGNRGLRQEFIDTLNSIKNPQEAFNWFMDNAGIAFKPEFWEELTNNSISSTDKFTSAINQALNTGKIAQDKADELLSDIELLNKLQKNKSNFLKQFRNSLNPAETDADVISEGAKEVFRKLESDIQNLYSTLNSSLKNYMPKVVTNPLETESTSNESFDKDFKEARMINPSLTVVDFALKHMTELNATDVNKFKRQIEFFRINKTIKSDSVKTFRRVLNLSDTASINEIVSVLNKMEQNNTLDSVLENYARTKLSSYYKRFAPIGYTNFISQLKAGSVEVNGTKMSSSDLLVALSKNELSGKDLGVFKYLQVKPESEWLEDSSAVTENPNYIKTTSSSRHMGGYNQPKYDKYKNTEFINKYDIDESVYKEFGRIQSSGNIDSELKKELGLINFLVQSRYDNLEMQNLAGQANAYTLPGVRRTSIENTTLFAKNPIAGVKEWWRDNVSNTVDKKIYGETATGDTNMDPGDVNNLVVPTLNVAPLEDIQDTTQDLLYSYSVHTYNAHLYKNRQEALAEANQLESLLLRTSFNNKEANKSNAFKAFQDFKKAYIYGVQETSRIKFGIGGGKTMDLTNLLRAFDRALGTVNVGLNPAVSITAATSATTFSFTEAVVGQYMNPESLSKGISRFHSKAASFIGESGVIDKTNEISILGERFGLYNILRGVENSGASRALRELFSDGVGGMPHILTEIATKPFAPSTMYGVLDDTRLVNGELMDFNTFKASFKGTKSEMNNKWKALESNSVLNNLTIENGDITYSKLFEDYFETRVGGKEAFEDGIKTKISTLISRIDAKMPMHDKSVASRNALARFLLRHREWFTINFQNRFKGAHENLYTGQTEEGTYITLYRFVKDMTMALNPKNTIKVQDIIEELEPYERLNLRRVLIDSAISLILITIGALLIAPWDDDEKNKNNWNVQFLSYMYYRLASEQMSSGLLGIPSYKDVLEAPFVAVNSLKEVLTPENWTLKEVERGPYEGHSKLFKLAAKNTFARHYFDLVHGLEEKSDFYRLQNQWTLMMMQKTSKEEKEEQKQYEEELNNSFIWQTERFVR